jgi:spectrin alpha
MSGAKLTEACQQQQFNRNVEDVERWLNDIESSLVSEDYGKVGLLSVVSKVQHKLLTCRVTVQDKLLTLKM